MKTEGEDVCLSCKWDGPKSSKRRCPECGAPFTHIFIQRVFIK